jgi:hypothetical protein
MNNNPITLAFLQRPTLNLAANILENNEIPFRFNGDKKTIILEPEDASNGLAELSVEQIWGSPSFKGEADFILIEAQ